MTCEYHEQDLPCALQGSLSPKKNQSPATRMKEQGETGKGNSPPTATSNACFWVWVHILVNLVAMAFYFTMNLCLPWVLNFILSQARLLRETACNYIFSVLVHGIPSTSAWISIHQNSRKLFCANTSIGR